MVWPQGSQGWTFTPQCLAATHSIHIYSINILSAEAAAVNKTTLLLPEAHWPSKRNNESSGS
jgi:hypothetical protein